MLFIWFVGENMFFPEYYEEPNWFLFDCEVTLISGSGKNMFVFSGSPRVWSTGIGEPPNTV